MSPMVPFSMRVYIPFNAVSSLRTAIYIAQYLAYKMDSINMHLINCI